MIVFPPHACSAASTFISRGSRTGSRPWLLQLLLGGGVGGGGGTELCGPATDLRVDNVLQKTFLWDALSCRAAEALLVQPNK